MSVQEVENMTLAQKRMAAMIMETTADDVEAHRAKQAAEDEAAAAAAAANDDAEMEQSDDEEVSDQKAEEERQRAIAQATAMQASATTGPMKIRTDYVPKRASASIHLHIIVTDLYCSSRREEGQSGHDHMYDLWAANRRGRAAGTHAYRAARPQVEGTARQLGGAQSASVRIAARCQCRHIIAEPRTHPCGYLRYRDGRGEAEARGGHRKPETQGAREDRLGWSYFQQSECARQVLYQCQH